MATNWGRRETVTIEHGGERMDYVFCPDAGTRWKFAAWNKLVCRDGTWVPVDSWNSEWSQTPYQPEVPAQVMQMLTEELCRQKPWRWAARTGAGGPLVALAGAIRHIWTRPA